MEEIYKNWQSKSIGLWYINGKGGEKLRLQYKLFCIFILLIIEFYIFVTMKLGGVIKIKVFSKDDQNLIFQTTVPKEGDNHENWALPKNSIDYKEPILNGCLK